MDRIRIGLIGAGAIARAHIRGYLECKDRAVVVALAEPGAGSASAALRMLGGDVSVYEDWRELLDRSDVDAVDVCLPHDLHASATIAAAELGKHVLVEKPIARDLEEADAMIAAAERSRVKLMVCYARRYHPSFEKIKELVDSGAIGKLLCLRLDHNGYVTFTPDNWKFQKTRLGGGAIMSCLTHHFDLMRWYAGDVRQVGGLSITLPERMEGEIVGVVSLRFASGAIGDAVINWNLRGGGLPGGLWNELVWLSGTEGNLHNLDGIHVLRYRERSERYESLPWTEGTGYQRAIAHFVDCLRADRQPLTDGREGRAALEVAMAAYASEESKRFVELPLAGAAYRPA